MPYDTSRMKIDWSTQSSCRKRHAILEVGVRIVEIGTVEFNDAWWCVCFDEMKEALGEPNEVASAVEVSMPDSNTCIIS